MSKQKWDPLFPDLAEAKRGGVPEEYEDRSPIPWVVAPDSSHLEQFRLIDARDQNLVRRLLRPLLGGRSEIQIRYRPTRTQPGSEYSFFFDDHEEARRIFVEMAASDSPGTIEAAELRGRVPYRKNAVSG